MQKKQTVKWEFQLRKDLHQKLKILSIEQEKSMTEIVNDAVEKYLEGKT